MNQEPDIRRPAAFPDISVAPMMDWTDRHCRYFHRLLAPHIRLYTEMITAAAILHGDRERLLRFDPAEHPLALQLGGSDPAALARCAKIAESTGYDEINLNCGCPSDRVQSGQFGACLMREPALVAECVAAIKNSAAIPVTVKCRIGIDHQDDEAFLHEFIHRVMQGGCETFIIHARKAWLKGLSPKQNREVPPLDYGRVRRMKKLFPSLKIIVNGGITALAAVKDHLKSCDGVMIGREAYQNPWFLAGLESAFTGCPPPHSREDTARAMAAYARQQSEEYGTPVKSIARHMTGLFHGRPGARAWRRALSTLPHEAGADADVILEALKQQEQFCQIETGIP